MYRFPTLLSFSVIVIGFVQRWTRFRDFDSQPSLILGLVNITLTIAVAQDRRVLLRAATMIQPLLTSFSTLRIANPEKCALVLDVDVC